jgi:hypothetical protein
MSDKGSSRTYCKYKANIRNIRLVFTMPIRNSLSLTSPDWRMIVLGRLPTLLPWAHGGELERPDSNSFLSTPNLFPVAWKTGVKYASKVLSGPTENPCFESLGKAISDLAHHIFKSILRNILQTGFVQIPNVQPAQDPEIYLHTSTFSIVS